MPQQQTVNYLVSGGVDATNAVAVGKSIAADLATKAGFSTDANGNVTGLMGPSGNINLATQLGRKFVSIGDSISADSAQVSGTIQTWGPWGYLTWMRRYLGQRAYFPISNILAVAGTTISQVSSGQLAAAIALNPSVVTIECGINDVTPALAADTAAHANATFAAMIAAYAPMISALRGANIFVICVCIRTCAAPTALTTLQTQLVSRFNKWLQTTCKQNSGCLCYDPNPLYLDYSTGYAVASLLRDGKHDTIGSAKTMGADLASRITPLLPAHYDLLDMVNGPYDAVANPTGALLTNGLMSGTGGGVNNGVTGTCATGWNLYRANNSGTVTVVGSSGNVSGFTNLPKQIITIGGTGDGNTIQLEQTQTIPGNCAIGDYVVFEMMLDWSLTAGFQQIGININGRDTSYVSYSQSWDGVGNVSSYGSFTAMTDTGVLFRTEPIQLKTGATVLDTFLQIITPSSGAITGTISVYLANCYKVNIS